MRTPEQPAGGRRGGIAIVAALSVAAVVVGIAAISVPRGDEPGAAASNPPAETSDSVIEVDQGTADPKALAACLDESFAADPAEAEVLYGVGQLGQDGDTPALVVRNAAGEVRVCDAAEIGPPAVEPLPTVSEDEPLAFLTNGSATWDCDGDVLSGYQATTWLLVHDGVARVQQRFVVDGTAGPWFSAGVDGGIAHLPAWLGPQPDGVEIVAEQRALDADGAVVPQKVWPQRQSLVGCPRGATDGDGDGDAQIL